MASRRSWRFLLGLWGAYWAGLAVFALGPLAVAVYRATSAPDGHGSVTASLGDGGFVVTVIRDGQTIYSMSLHVIAAALWIAVPPLLAWLAFAIGARRRVEQTA
jgi:hypothetical protein